MTQRQIDRIISVLSDHYVYDPMDFDRMEYNNRTIDFLIEYFEKMEVCDGTD